MIVWLQPWNIFLIISYGCFNGIDFPTNVFHQVSDHKDLLNWSWSIVVLKNFGGRMPQYVYHWNFLCESCWNTHTHIFIDIYTHTFVLTKHNSSYMSNITGFKRFEDHWLEWFVEFHNIWRLYHGSKSREIDSWRLYKAIEDWRLC